MTLGTKIRRIRLERRMTMKETATLIGVSLSTYRDWEYGRKISSEYIGRIAKALRTPIGVLIEDKTKPEHGQTRGERAIQLLEEALELLKKA